MLRPSPNHGTQRLPNYDDDDDFIVNVNVTCGGIFDLLMTIHCVFFMLIDSLLCRLASTTVFNSSWSSLSEPAINTASSEYLTLFRL